MDLNHLPVLGVCGFSGSGKTTLIENLLPLLIAKGLKVAVIKHDVHGVQVDQPGKDSSRLFTAGADVFLQGIDESFFRSHDGSKLELIAVATDLAHQYDLVLVEGHKQSSIPKVWLLKQGETAPPEDSQGVVKVLPWNGERRDALSSFIDEWLLDKWQQPPVYGCVLIGGQSRRMGRPKHLISTNGVTWLENTVENLKQVVDRVILVGGGHVPEHLSDYVRLHDAPGVSGPLAGLIAAMRWAPDVSWLACACDMPGISVDSLRWLLASRAPGVWAVMPDLEGNGHVEPLLAHYDFRSRKLLEELLARQRYAPSALVPHSKIITPIPPEKLISAWRNVNTENELLAGEL